MLVIHDLRRDADCREMFLGMCETRTWFVRVIVDRHSLQVITRFSPLHEKHDSGVSARESVVCAAPWAVGSSCAHFVGVIQIDPGKRLV